MSDACPKCGDKPFHSGHICAVDKLGQLPYTPQHCVPVSTPHKPLRLKIRIDGPTFFDEIQGEVLMWSNGVKLFKSEPKQVPCVLIKTGPNVRAINLQQYLHTVIVTEIQGHE